MDATVLKIIVDRVVKNIGVDDVFVFAIDGLNGFNQVIQAVYPKAEIQRCKNRSKPDNDARVRPDAKTEFNRTVKRCSTGH